mmetsp:Transcript_5588/g.16624  ORF Transcript_5588/g.16624 Transcript_5588/m.16624 type:complete len:254 (-) Transcript_5588:261-1022(-)
MWSTLMIFSWIVYRRTFMQLARSKRFWVSENLSLNSAKLTLPSPETTESTPKPMPPLPSPLHLIMGLLVCASVHEPRPLVQRGGVIASAPLNITMGHCATKDSSTYACDGGGVGVFFGVRSDMMFAPICMSYGTTFSGLTAWSSSWIGVSNGCGVAYSQSDRTFCACEASSTSTWSEALMIFLQGSGAGVESGSFSVTGGGVSCPAWLINRLTLAQYSSEMVSFACGTRRPEAPRRNSSSWPRRSLALELPRK